jgi:hypothetical protein
MFGEKVNLPAFKRRASNTYLDNLLPLDVGGLSLPALLNRVPSGKFNRARLKRRGILACFRNNWPNNHSISCLTISFSEHWGTEDKWQGDFTKILLFYKRL